MSFWRSGGGMNKWTFILERSIRVWLLQPKWPKIAQYTGAECSADLLWAAGWQTVKILITLDTKTAVCGWIINCTPLTERIKPISVLHQDTSALDGSILSLAEVGFYHLPVLFRSYLLCESERSWKAKMLARLSDTHQFFFSLWTMLTRTCSPPRVTCSPAESRHIRMKRPCWPSLPFCRPVIRGLEVRGHSETHTYVTMSICVHARTKIYKHTKTNWKEKQEGLFHTNTQATDTSRGGKISPAAFHTSIHAHTLQTLKQEEGRQSNTYTQT